MKAGDKVWVPATASIVFPSGDVWFTDRGGFNIQRVEQSIPDHPALPAVARWLAETPGAVEALRIVGRSAMQDRSVPLRHIEKYGALLAALTTEEPA